MSGGNPVPEAIVRRIVLDEAERAMHRATNTVEGEWKRRLVPGVRGYRTGTYARSITNRVTRYGDRVVGEVGSALQVAKWLEYGTGIYGPEHRLIRPKKPGGVLRFPEPGNAAFTLAGRQRSGRAGAGARWVYARYVRGIRPRRYAHDAALIARPKVIRIFRQAGERVSVRLIEQSGGPR